MTERKEAFFRHAQCMRLQPTQFGQRYNPVLENRVLQVGVECFRLRSLGFQAEMNETASPICVIRLENSDSRAKLVASVLSSVPFQSGIVTQAFDLQIEFLVRLKAVLGD